MSPAYVLLANGLWYTERQAEEMMILKRSRMLTIALATSALWLGNCAGRRPPAATASPQVNSPPAAKPTATPAADVAADSSHDEESGAGPGWDPAPEAPEMAPAGEVALTGDVAAEPPPPAAKGYAEAREKRKAARRDTDDEADSFGFSMGTASGGARSKSRRPSPKKAESPTPRTSRRETGPRITSRRPTIAAPAMKAGRHDDNNQYNRFLQFLDQNAGLVVYPVDISERLVVRAVDKNGKALPNCQIEIKNTRGVRLASHLTYADGRTHFFPRAKANAKNDQDYILKAECMGGKVRNSQIARQGRRQTDIVFREPRAVPARLPVDIAIVIDTTGSMGNQIDRLKKTLQAIHFQLTSLPANPDIRFGMVAYRDRGDSYITQVTGFDDNVDAFQRVVDRLDADGGGDTPEDLQAALDKAMHELNWRKQALRLGFIVADAIPHTDYGQTYDYREAMKESLRRGIKWTTVGAGGLPRAGEVIFRQIAQFTMGEYVFVTQSGGGDREGGVGEASHHVGTNYKTENLDQAIVRIVRREISQQTDDPRDFDYTVVAKGDKSTPRDVVLAPAVQEVVRQLVDYSSLRLAAATPAAVLPIATNDEAYKDVAGYLTDEMVLAASRHPTFKVVERDLNAVAQEHKIQMGDLFDVEKAVPLGNMVGAELLVVAKLTVTGDKAQLFAKLVWVETGEMLSVAKADLVGGIVQSS